VCHGFAQGVLGLPWFAGMGDPSGEEFPREAGVRHLGKFADPAELAAGDDIGDAGDVAEVVADGRVGNPVGFNLEHVDVENPADGTMVEDFKATLCVHSDAP